MPRSRDAELSTKLTAEDQSLAAFKSLMVNATKTNQSLGMMMGSLTSIQGAAGLVGMAGGLGVATLGIGTLVRTMEGAVQTFSTFERTTTGFAEQFGDDVQKNLQILREMSGGTISDLGLVMNANRAAMLGVSKDVEQLGQLMMIARARGRAMGKSTEAAFGDLVIGIGRQSKLILDNLGIFVNADEAYRKYAQSIGKATSALTQFEKKQAFVQAISESSQGLVDANTGLSLTASAYDRLNTNVSNFNVELGRTAANQFKEVVDDMGQAIKAFTEAMRRHNDQEPLRLLGELEEDREALANLQKLRKQVEDFRANTDVGSGGSAAAFALAGGGEMQQAQASMLFGAEIAAKGLGAFTDLFKIITAGSVEAANAQMAFDRALENAEIERYDKKIQAAEESLRAYLKMQMIQLELETNKQKEMNANSDDFSALQHAEQDLKIANIKATLSQADSDKRLNGIYKEQRAEVDALIASGVDLTSTKKKAGEELQKFVMSLDQVRFSGEQLANQLMEMGDAAGSMLTSLGVGMAVLSGNFAAAMGMADQLRGSLQGINTSALNEAFASGEEPDAARMQYIQGTATQELGKVQGIYSQLKDKDEVAAEEYMDQVADSSRRTNDLLYQLQQEGIQVRAEDEAKYFNQSMGVANEAANERLDALKRVDDAESRAYSGAMSLVTTAGIPAAKQYASGVKKALADTEIAYRDHLAATGKTWDPNEWNMWAAQAVAPWDKWRDGVTGALSSTQNRAEQVTDYLRGLFDNLIQPTLGDVVKENEQKAINLQAGIPEEGADRVDESARRMAAIALRGFSDELWEPMRDSGLIPEDVIAQGEEAVKTFAAKAVIAFQKGQSFELFDKGTIKELVAQKIKADVARKEFVQSILQEFQQEGNWGVTQQDIETAMGLKPPQMVASPGEFFKLQGEPVSVNLEELVKVETGAGVGAGTNTVGTQMGDAILHQAQAANVPGRMLQQLDVDFDGMSEQYKGSGKKVGGWMSDGILEELSDKVPPGFLDVLVVRLLPLIISSLAVESER